MKQARHFLCALLVLATVSTHAQVAIGTPTPDVSAQLDITSIAKGLLIPWMTAAQRIAVDLNIREGHSFFSVAIELS